MNFSLTSGNTGRAGPQYLYRDLHLRRWRYFAGCKRGGQRDTGSAAWVVDHVPRNLDGRHGIVRAGFKFWAAYGAVTLVTEIPAARVTGQSRAVACEKWIARTDHEPCDSRKPPATLSGCRSSAASSTVVCADYRIVFGRLGLRDLCHVAIHSQSAVGVSEVVALAGDCTYAVRSMAAEQERHLDSRQDSES